jgi:hypothetical protein
MEENSFGRLDMKLFKHFPVQHWKHNHLFKATNVVFKSTHMTKPDTTVK